MASRQVITLKNAPAVTSWAAVVGKKEKLGPLGECFSQWSDDTAFGQKSWEKAESELQRRALSAATAKNGIERRLGLITGGDLLNQCVAASYAVRESGVPFLGLYGACSTMAESLALAGLMVDSGQIDCAAALTSSHFCSAERQFRFPLEYGGQRPQASQWTVTGSGCAVVEPAERGSGVCLRAVTIGRVVDLGVTDINNMGAAMAPAAADTLIRYFKATGTKPADYDRVYTGDLGQIGSELARRMCRDEGFPLDNHEDCGLLIYDRQKQYVGSGGSGCGCSASVLCGCLLDKLQKGELRDILFVATGALMSPTTFQQKESIPGIAHLVRICSTAKMAPRGNGK